MCAYSEDITWTAPRCCYQNCTQLAEEYRSGRFYPPTILYGGSGGMVENRVTDRRYHDVNDAGMDETRDLLSQLRTVFSIVGK